MFTIYNKENYYLKHKRKTHKYIDNRIWETGTYITKRGKLLYSICIFMFIDYAEAYKYNTKCIMSIQKMNIDTVITYKYESYVLFIGNHKQKELH